VAALSIIIKTDRGGRMSVERTAPGLTHTKAEAEASRMRFRDEAHSYCVYTGLFASVEAASEFVRCRNAGMPIHVAFRRANPNAPISS
jgi:hypothetical protein